jgi:uncharacterized protein
LKLKILQPFIIGSSLGGFYANFFHKKLSIPCLLVNPSLKPHISLSVKFGVGVHTNPDTGIQVNLKTKHIDSFRDIFQQTQQITEKPDLLNLLISKDDELLPYKQTLNYFKVFNKLILLENGGHKMENFEEQIPVIKELIDEFNYRFLHIVGKNNQSKKPNI